MPSRRITIRDVAARAGVHFSTVSLALKSHPRIPENTRKRIIAIAEEMKYRPDPALNILNNYRRGTRFLKYNATLVFVTRWASVQHWKRKPMYAHFMKGAKERSLKLGFKVEEFAIDMPRLSSRRITQILYHRNISGLIIAPLPTARGHLHIDWDRFSLVAVGYSLVSPLLHRVANHQYRSMIKTVRNLRRLGYKKIGLALEPGVDERSDHNWSSAYNSVLMRVGRGNGIPVFYLERSDSFEAWIVKYSPQVVISTADYVKNILERIGLRVPQDIGFVHTDCVDDSGRIAGIFQNWEMMGSTAVDFLSSQLQRQEKGVPETPITLLVDGKWVEGATIRRL